MNHAAVETGRITIRVNDQAKSVGGATTLATLLDELELANRKGVAVAVNDSVIARAAWTSHALAEGDRVLVIRATQGG